MNREIFSDEEIADNSAMTVAEEVDHDNPRLSVSQWCDIKFIGTHGIYAIHTATRYGRKYFFKSLAEKYRGLPEWQRLLYKEFEIGIQLDHPGIARTNAWDKIPGIGETIVMEFIDGVELRQWLRQDSARSRKARLGIVRQIADVLVYIHSRGISHRDLKLDNVMATRLGNRVKIIDFGLGDSEDFVVYKRAEGTPSFGAPEQNPESRTEASMSADIYALGRMIDILLPGLRYRRLARICQRHDPSRRPSAVEVAHRLNANPLNRLSLIIIAAILIASTFLGLFLLKPSANTPDSPAYPSRAAQPITPAESVSPAQPDTVLPTVKETPHPPVNTDALHPTKPDTVTAKGSAGPSVKATDEIWEKTIKSLKHLLGLYEESVENGSHDMDWLRRNAEKEVESWGEWLYFEYLEMGCDDAFARSKREELKRHMHKCFERIFANASPASATDTSADLREKRTD